MLYDTTSKRITQAQTSVDKYMVASYGNGGWGYHPGAAPATEPTSWCAISLRAGPSHIKGGVTKFLLESQNQNGGWSTGPGIGHSDWTSGPAILCLRLLHQENPNTKIDRSIARALSQSYRYLFESRVDFFGPAARLLIFLRHGPEGLAYGRGWPWTEHCFNWVEPTSYNLLALRVPKLPVQDVFENVIKHANQFFIEHACEEGGWNHGSDIALGVHLPPYAVTTAEALLVLQDHKEHPVIKRALDFLDSVASFHPSAMSLAWAILARRAHGQEAQTEIDALIDRQNPDGSFGPNLMVTGLCATALKAVVGPNPFIFTQLIG